MNGDLTNKRFETQTAEKETDPINAPIELQDFISSSIHLWRNR